MVTGKGNKRKLTATLAEGGNLKWRIEPVTDPSERQVRLREGWLASVVPAGG